MRRRVLSALSALYLAAFALLVVSQAVAQQTTAISIVTHSAEIDSLLQDGRRMEVECRWGEALSHYEEAIRQFPHDAGLKRRFSFTRLHYDVGRRYADRSFCRAIETLPFEEALELYDRVLLKIESHYVDVPHWKELVEHGTDNLSVALSEPAFVDRNLVESSSTVTDEFRSELRRMLEPLPIATRRDAGYAVSAAAALTRQRLGLSPTAVVLEYLCGATNALDRYSAYLTPDQLNEVYSQIEGNFVGLGIELKADGGELLIVRVITGSPAQQAGMLDGDRILAVDGRSTRNLTTDQAANLLQGAAGSTVNLIVVTSGEQPRRLSVCRRRVDVPSIDRVKIIDRQHGIAYLRLACFQKTTCRDLDEALWKLHRKGMKSLIVDLRGNPGGLLMTAVEVVDKFVERGVIVSTRGRSTQEDFTYTARVPGTWRVPLVVIIDNDSASAAEIVAGAIRDHRRGTVVGVRSYGKGSVQGIFPLDMSTAGVRLTTAKFYSPTGRPYTRIGVEPDVTVRLAAKPIDGQIVPVDGDDAMLSAAVQAARGLGRSQQARNLR